MQAVVMDCNGKNAVLLKEDGTFVTVRDSSYSIGQQIETGATRRIGLGSLAAAACMCLVIGLGAAGVKLWFTPYAHVEVCTDYSVGLTLNRFNYVIDANVESDENAVLTEEFRQKVENKKVSDAVRETIAHTSEKEKAQVKVISPDMKEQKKIREQVANSVGDENIHIEESETTGVQASHESLQMEMIPADAATEATEPEETIMETPATDPEETIMETPVTDPEETLMEAEATDPKETLMETEEAAPENPVMDLPDEESTIETPAEEPTMETPDEELIMGASAVDSESVESVENEIAD